MSLESVQIHPKEKLSKTAKDFMRLGFALLFLFGVLTFSFLSNSGISNNMFLAIAALIGAYMAMNIGANDVANNVGPAVGSKAIPMIWAVVLAAFFEAMGAFIAGGDVINTIKKGIIDIQPFSNNPDPFIWAMMAALLSAALWLNVATLLKTPVSTTHSIVGGVMGAGIAAAGFGIVDWDTMSKIALSWVISPLLGGIIAAAILFSIKKSILFQKERLQAAKIYIPIYVALMAWAFTTYLTIKGLKKVWPQLIEYFNVLTHQSIPHASHPSFSTAVMLGGAVALLVYIFLRKKLSSYQLQHSEKEINALFNIPLIFAAALLSFAHGANDVANAIGPLAAISEAIINGGVVTQANIPFWVMTIGALGIALGLLLYGPRLIRSVGSEITQLNQIRAFSVALAAALTVILASQLGLPVSSTHIAIGGIFGVGFLREYLRNNEKYNRVQEEVKHIQQEQSNLQAYTTQLHQLENKEEKTIVEYERMVALYKLINQEEKLLRKTKRELSKIQSNQFISRDVVKKIVAAWLVTVPASALLSAVIYFAIRGIML